MIPFLEENVTQNIYMRKSSYIYQKVFKGVYTEKGENMIQNEIVICLVWDSLKPFEVVILFSFCI